MLVVLLLQSVLTLSAQTTSVTVGLPGVPASANCIPFGCSGFDRYQQVYDKAEFPEPLEISEIRFYFEDAVAHATPTLRAGIYILSLSTTSAGVGGLDLQNLDVNVGADSALFCAKVLQGSAPSVLSFVGKPFAFDPARGNLLLDVRIVSPTHPNQFDTIAFYQAQILSPEASPFSSAAVTNDGHFLSVSPSVLGLGTEFRSASALIEDVAGELSALNLPNDLSSSLSATLEQVKKALDAPNGSRRQDAANKLRAFTKQVTAQDGRRLSSEQAATLLAAADRASFPLKALNVSNVQGSVSAVYPPAGTLSSFSPLPVVASLNIQFDIPVGAGPFQVLAVGETTAALLDFNPSAGTYSGALSVPTDATRHFDFTSTYITALDFLYGGQPFPANIVPASRWDPLAIGALNLLPLPNLSYPESSIGLMLTAGTASPGTHFAVSGSSNPSLSLFGGFVPVSFNPAITSRTTPLKLYVDGRLVAATEVSFTTP